MPPRLPTPVPQAHALLVAFALLASAALCGCSFGLDFDGIEACAEGEVVREGVCACGDTFVRDELSGACVCPSGTQLRDGRCECSPGTVPVELGCACMSSLGALPVGGGGIDLDGEAAACEALLTSVEVLGEGGNEFVDVALVETEPDRAWTMAVLERSSARVHVSVFALERSSDGLRFEARDSASATLPEMGEPLVSGFEDELIGIALVTVDDSGELVPVVVFGRAAPHWLDFAPTTADDQRLRPVDLALRYSDVSLPLASLQPVHISGWNSAGDSAILMHGLYFDPSLTVTPNDWVTGAVTFERTGDGGVSGSGELVHLGVPLFEMPDERQCSPLEFACITDQGMSEGCVPIAHVCDGAADCSNASDENPRLCVEDGGSFRCPDGASIAFGALCNGVNDCAPAREVVYDEHPSFCGCLRQHGLCNGVSDCADGLDESDALCVAWPTFTCTSGSPQTVGIGQVCNGSADCGDGSDEDTALCACFGSVAAGVECHGASEGCVFIDQECDGVDHCGNGGDEWPLDPLCGFRQPYGVNIVELNRIRPILNASDRFVTVGSIQRQGYDGDAGRFGYDGSLGAPLVVVFEYVPETRQLVPVVSSPPQFDANQFEDLRSDASQVLSGVFGAGNFDLDSDALTLHIAAAAADGTDIFTVVRPLVAVCTNAQLGVNGACLDGAPATGEDCADGQDNDGNGAIDCADGACGLHLACPDVVQDLRLLPDPTGSLRYARSVDQVRALGDSLDLGLTEQLVADAAAMPRRIEAFDPTRLDIDASERLLIVTSELSGDGYLLQLSNVTHDQVETYFSYPFTVPPLIDDLEGAKLFVRGPFVMIETASGLRVLELSELPELSVIDTDG